MKSNLQSNYESNTGGFIPQNNQGSIDNKKLSSGVGGIEDYEMPQAQNEPESSQFNVDQLQNEKVEPLQNEWSNFGNQQSGVNTGEQNFFDLNQQQEQQAQIESGAPTAQFKQMNAIEPEQIYSEGSVGSFSESSMNELEMY